jgi:hypothetical protein
MKPLFPYKTLFGDLQVAVSDVRVDGVNPGDERVVSVARSIDLAKLDKDKWLQVSLDISVSAPIDEVNSFEGNGPLSVTAIVHCVATNVRFAFALDRSLRDPAKWRSTIELSRGAFSGPARVRFVLTGNAGGRPNRWLGEAEEWTIHFDEPAIPDFEGTMRVEWVSFKDSAMPELREFEQEAFYPSFDPARPTLYLNKDFDGLPALLRDKKRTGPELAIHESTRMGIASEVWGGLFNAALASVIEQEESREAGDGDDEVAWPDVDWQTNVLRSLLNDMYEVRSPEEGLKELREAWRSHGGAQIQSQLLGAIQMRVGTRNLLARSIKAINLARAEGE